MESSYNSVSSITLGELLDAGAFDYMNDARLKWDAYDSAQYERVCKKIIGRFKYRDIGLIPYAKWRDAYVRRMNEIMPKLNPLYNALENGINIISESDIYGGSNDVYSDFPQTQLSGNQDYASNMRQHEYEDIAQGDWIEKTREIANSYDDIDVIILNELEPIFSCLMSVSMNGF